MEETKRYKTMPIDKLDHEYLGHFVVDQWNRANIDRDVMLQKREDWTQNWRDINAQRTQGPWENSSDFNVPITLINGKAIHARLWQLFSDPSNFFGVKARKEVFQDREEDIRAFMNFIVWNYANSKNGLRDVFDEWLWDVVFEGSGYLKLYWRKEVHSYIDVTQEVKVKEKTIFDTSSITGRTEFETESKEVEKPREDVLETPYIGRILMEDINLPIGESDPQTSRWVSHIISMKADELKERAAEGKFDSSVVEEVLKVHATRYIGDNTEVVKRTRNDVDGYIHDRHDFEDHDHHIIEWYGKAFVEPEFTDKLETDLSKRQQEIVAWIDKTTQKVLGWTYLYRISPSGIRPIFKGDFIRFPNRSHGVGVGEVLAPIQQSTNAIYNLRMDNGVISSTPIGFYRASSGLKPDKIRVQPGQFIPVDDPANDVRTFQIPFMSGFGYQEEDRLNMYAERLLTISDLNLGRTPQKVGMFRTASGAGAMQAESGIQLEIHFDRLARTLNKLLQALFRLCRERMPEELYFRVTGQQGEPVFGKVNRDDLRGEWDFEVNVDLLGENKMEGQQKATMMMQMLINPAFMQSGVIGPDNLYHLVKNFLQKYGIRRIDNFISEPPNYQGEVITPQDRIFRIAVGNYMNPPIEDTVRLSDNHEKAIQVYDGFKQTDFYGAFQGPQVAALEKLIQKHAQLLQAQQAGGNPNAMGMQLPREGLAPIQGGTPEQGTLGSPVGEANGPVV